jgi:hypothetical protein
MLTDQEIADKEAFAEAFIAEVLASVQGAFLVAAENGMTLEKAAQELDLTPGELEDIIWGRTELTLRTLGEIAHVFSCEIDFEIVPKEDLNKPMIPDV